MEQVVRQGSGAALQAMVWSDVPFAALATQQLYEILALRQTVFIVEQRCPFQDADGLDQAARHLQGRSDGGLAAYARILPPGVKYAVHSIGRVAVAPMMRGTGLGRMVMREAIARIAAAAGPVPIRIAAQHHLADPFYAPLGFSRIGAVYEEDGIVHVDMLHGGAAPFP